MGFSWKTYRSKHPKQSQKIQDDFKKFKIETPLKIPDRMGLETVDVCFQDKARFGQQNTTTRLWTKRGIRPRVVKQQQFEYGSVFPAKGVDEAMVIPWVNKEIMIEQVWRWLRQHCLANQSSVDYNDIVSKVCAAWSHFLECKNRVSKM